MIFTLNCSPNRNVSVPKRGTWNEERGHVPRSRLLWPRLAARRSQRTAKTTEPEVACCSPRASCCGPASRSSPSASSMPGELASTRSVWLSPLHCLLWQSGLTATGFRCLQVQRRLVSHRRHLQGHRGAAQAAYVVVPLSLALIFSLSRDSNK